MQAQKARAALELLFVGDALSMPAHWYYRPADIRAAFPPNGIREYHAAPELHPSSIMALHSTSKGGRGEQGVRGQIVGEVILKGKAHYWNRKNMHYHQGLDAGENTLNTWCARLLINWLSDRKTNTDYPVYDLQQWLQCYVDFMTADPPRHPDTYAESYHRGFFANYESGRPMNKCGAVTHDTPSMGALVTVAPLALAYFPVMSLESVQEICREHIWSTHPDNQLMKVVDAYVKLMHQFMHNTDDEPKQFVQWFCDAAAVVSGGNISSLFKAPLDTGRDEFSETQLMKHLSTDMTIVGGRYSLACYITDSWPSVCYLAAKYYSQPEHALLVNTNLGGENAHRGSVLGSLVGLASGRSVEKLFQGLYRYDEINSDLDLWLQAFYSDVS